MTGGFLCVPIMRPRRRWTVLHASILAALLLSLNADSEDSGCDIEIRVRRYTVYNATPGECLSIDCPVRFCNDSPPTVSWHKLEKKHVPVNVSSASHIKTEWTLSNPLEGISHLVFQQILASHSGLYQCQFGGSVSHAINVSVLERSNDTEKNNTRESTSFDSKPEENLWLYVYTAAGIVVFVIVVIIISVALMQGCKGQQKKETLTENQYMAIPMVEQPFTHASLQPSPRGSPCVPPSRRSTRRKTRPSEASELPPTRDNKHVHGKVKERDRERQRGEVEEEGSSVVYAALNHQPPAGAAPRPWRPQQEESSEYAAIRVKDPTPTRH